MSWQEILKGKIGNFVHDPLKKLLNARRRKRYAGF
jgi:hypothetical protein